MLRHVSLIILVMSIGFALVACGEEKADPDEPPEIAYGGDTCSRCGMIISEEKHASGIVDESGNAETFDDIGGMVSVLQEEGLGERRAWVHDYNTVEWIDATTAFYVVTEEVITPMGFGVLAFGTQEAAETFASDQTGMVMSWETMMSEWKLSKQ